MALELITPYPSPVAQATGPAMFVEVDGVEFESRDFAYTDDVTTLADAWSVTIPCPDGKATSLAGKRVPVKDFKIGSLVRLRESDPAVEGGAKLPRLIGRLTDKQDSNDERAGFILNLSGYDLGWHLTTGHGGVFTNYRGVQLRALVEKLVLDPANNWGFTGVEFDNLANTRSKIGPRSALEANRFKGVKDDSTPSPGAIQPRFQFEPGMPIGPVIMDIAKWERRFVNVSSTGKLIFFAPKTTAAVPLYSFHHQAAEQDQIYPRNNIFHSSLRESADGLNTITQCWTSVVIPPANQDTDNPNRGRYCGTHEDTAILPFRRRNTFSDPNQMGKDRATRRAKWAHDRGIFDSWEYTFTTYGHSQDGIPYISDQLASLRDTVRGIQGVFYVQRVQPSRKLTGPGIASGAGTTCQITLKLPNLLGA